MSTQTKELIDICERLPEKQQAELADFARHLLQTNEEVSQSDAAERWLATATGAAIAGVTTKHLMALSRDES